MRPTWCSCAAMMFLAMASAAGAEDPAESKACAWQDRVTLTASDRARGEFVDWFTPERGRATAGADRYSFFANQLRLGARVTAPQAVFAIELQDTRLVNLPNDASLSPPEGNLGPGALYFFHTRDRDQGEPFLKKGYLTLTNLAGANGLTATIGRFEYADGLETVPTDTTLAWLKRARIGERLVGPFGFTHVTRSLDGAQVAYDQPRWNLTALASRPTHGGFEVSANRELKDVALAGLALTFKEIPDLTPTDLRLFYLYYEDGRDTALKVDNRPRDARSSDGKDIEVHTWGGHAVATLAAGPGKTDALLWTVAQTGRWGELDHGAWAYAVEAGYQLPRLPAAPWLRVGYYRSSGDSDPGDRRHRTFFQVLPTARMYAQFPFFNAMNNQDLFAQLLLKPHPRIGIRTDYHWLRLTEAADLWYAGGGATNADVFGFAGTPSGGRRELAHLVDVGITASLIDRLTAYVYYGRAFGQGVVRQTFAGTGANYGYLELTFRY